MEKNKYRKSYTKIQISIGHIDSAIELFFNANATPSVHVLAATAFAILKDLPAYKNSIYIKKLEEIIKPGHEKLFFKQFNQALTKRL
jgi:hypothetical protein